MSSFLCSLEYKFRRDSRSGVGDVLLEGGQWNIALDSFGLRPSAQVNVHHVASQRLQTDRQER